MAILYSGTEGTCEWTIDDQGHLYIGDGVIDHATTSSDDWGWFQYSDKIKTVSSGNVSWALGANAYGMFYDCQLLTSFDASNFNTNNVTSMRAMFNDCRILTSLDLSNFDTSNVTEMTYMFTNCIFLTSLDVSNFNTSKVTDMSGMFSGCSSLISLDLSSFDTSKVENMILMFSDCQSLTSLNLSNFNTSSVTNMGSMFSDCHSLTSLNLSNFNTSKVTEMANMFNYCYSLISLDLSSFDTSNVTTMRYMFFRCSLLTAIIVSNKWTVASVTSSSNMFTNCNSLIGEQGTIYNSSHTDASYAHIDGGTSNPGYLIDINSCSCYASFNSDNKELRIFLDTAGKYTEGQVVGSTTYWADIENITGQNAPPWYENFSQNIESVKVINAYKPKTAYYLFKGCFNLVSLDLSNLDTSNIIYMDEMFRSCYSLTSLDVSNFNTSNVISMLGMFRNCCLLTLLDVSNFDTSKVTDMSNMFDNCTSLTSLNLSNFDTSRVTDISGMFYHCESLTSLNLSSFDTSNITNMNNIFYHCYLLTSLNLSNFDTSKVTDMSNMFFYCRSLISLDLSNFNTSEVTNMYRMFSNCRLLTSLNLSNFNTSKVTNMSDMFAECQSLILLNVSNFNTSNVTNMNSMFSNCKILTSLNLSNFNTSNVTNMNSMFSGCQSLTSLDLSNFNTGKVESMIFMFYLCTSLASLDLSSFNTSEVTTMGSMFYYCQSLTSLNLSNFDTSNVTNMSLMFSNCINLASLILPENFASNAKYFRSVFELDAKLTQLNITKMHLEKVEQLSDTFKKCPFSLNLVVGNVSLTSYTSAFEDSTGIFYIIDSTKSNTSWQTVASEYNNVFYNADGAFLPAYRLNAVRGSIFDDAWTNDEGGNLVRFTYNAGDTAIVSNIPEGFSCTSDTAIAVKENNTTISDGWTWENNTYILELQEPSKAHQYVMELTYNFVDEDGNTYTKTVSQLVSIAEPYALLDFRAGGKGIAVGKLSERNGFDIAFPVSIGEGLIPPGEWNYFQSKDTKVNNSKTYYTYDEQTGEYSEVSNPTTESPVEQGYYEREWSIDLKNYQLLVGDYNILNEDAYMIIGGGSDDEHRRNVLELDTGGLRIYAFNGTTQLAQLGYGPGASSGGGTSNAPFYTIGVRESGSAIGNYSVAEGCNTIASGFGSHAEGTRTVSTGRESHAEGLNTIANKDASHAEGWYTEASGSYSHAENCRTIASGNGSHSEGWYTKAIGNRSHAQNYYTIAASEKQTAIGQYNSPDMITDTFIGDGTTTDFPLSVNPGETGKMLLCTIDGQKGTSLYYYPEIYNGMLTLSEAPGQGIEVVVTYTLEKYAFIVGNGTADNARSNALTVDWSGNVMAQGMAGMIQMFAGKTPPNGWLLCDGSSKLISDYPELAAAL